MIHLWRSATTVTVSLRCVATVLCMQIVVPTLAGLTRFIHCLLLLHIHTIEILVTFL